jgi:hypothetical protein
MFAVQRIEFLGHGVTESSAKPLHSHVETIEKFPLPFTFKHCRPVSDWLTFTADLFHELPDPAASD